MSEHRVTEDEARLPDLIDRALAGEDVVITRDGEPVAALSPVHAKRGRGVTPDDLRWLAQRRVGRIDTLREDAGSLVSRMRDEEW